MGNQAPDLQPRSILKQALRYDVSQLFRKLAAEMACDTLSGKNPIAVQAELDAVCRHFFKERSELGRQAQAIFGPRAGFDWLNTPNPSHQGLTPHESVGEILFCDILRVLQADRWSLDHPGHSKVRMGWWRVLQLMGTDASIAEEVSETTGRDNDGEDYAGGAWLDLAPELGAKAQRLLGRTAGRKWMRTPHPALYGIAPYTHVVRQWSDAKAMEVLERDWAWLDNPDDPDVDPAWLEVLESLGATSGKSPKGEVDD